MQSHPGCRSIGNNGRPPENDDAYRLQRNCQCLPRAQAQLRTNWALGSQSAARNEGDVDSYAGHLGKGTTTFLQMEPTCLLITIGAFPPPWEVGSLIPAVV